MKRIILTTTLVAVAATSASAWNAGMPVDSYKPYKKPINHHKHKWHTLGKKIKDLFT